MGSVVALYESQILCIIGIEIIFGGDRRFSQPD